MKLLLALAIAAALIVPVKAQAATEYVLIWTNYNPFYTEVVAGPFESWSECSRMQVAEGYHPGGGYSCRIF